MRQFRQTGPFAALPLREPTPQDVELFLSHSSDLRCVLDADGNFIYLSPSWGTALDMATADLALQPLLHWVHPDDREATLHGLVEAVGSKNSSTFEHRLVVGEARPRWLRWTVQSEPSSGHLVGVAVDVTDTRAEIELHRKAVEASPTAVIMTDEQGGIVLVNRQFEVLFGYERSEILGQSVDTLIPLPLRARHQRLRGHFLADPDQRRMAAGRELFGVRKDGSAVQVEVTLCPLATAAGVHVLCSVVDITERKRHDAQLQAHVADLQRHREEMTLLSEMASLLQHAMSAAEAYDVAMAFAGRLFPGMGVRVFAQRGDSGILEAVPASEPADSIEVADCWALRRGQVHRSHPDHPPQCRHVQVDADSAHWCIPMALHGRAQALLVITARDAQVQAAQPHEVETLGRSVGDQLGKALHSLDLRERLRQLSVRDPLTDLYNRRYLDEAARRELARAERQAASVAVLMIDVDHFKRFNDNYGHVAADAALKELAALLQRNTRKEDVVCRYGGEEFVVILSGTDLARAAQHAERLRAACHAEGRVTLSIGVALFPCHGRDWSELLARADEALYQAKGAGRNQVCVAPVAT